jgi:dipeptidyl aminopeptidase/acylaminoacyl peptidase
MIALLGISHGGYLINKAIPHSKTGVKWLYNALSPDVL